MTVWLIVLIDGYKECFLEYSHYTDQTLTSLGRAMCGVNPVESKTSHNFLGQCLAPTDEHSRTAISLSKFALVRQTPSILTWSRQVYTITTSTHCRTISYHRASLYTNSDISNIAHKVTVFGNA